MKSPGQHAMEQRHALMREQKNWLTPQKLLISSTMTKEPVIIVRPKK
jgi:hypothetical protein